MASPHPSTARSRNCPPHPGRRSPKGSCLCASSLNQAGSEALNKARRSDTRPSFLVTVAFAALGAAPLSLAGCETGEPHGGAPMPLIGANGQTVGQVRAWQTAGGVTFRIEATGLPHGVHGIHVHTVGRCDPPDFESAGAHWNPATRKHGFNNPAGPHAGDLRNVEVAANGA